MDRIAVSTRTSGSRSADEKVEQEASRAPRVWVREVFANVVVIAVLVIAMEVWSRFVPPFIMPSPERTFSALVKALANDYVHIGLTVVRLCVAVLAALVIGTLIGAAMALVRPLEPFLKSIVVIDTGVPALSWMLFAIFWFEHAETRVFFILLMILVPFYALNVYDGIRALSRDLIEMVETFRPSRWQVAKTYFVTGVDHILFGYDHLLFVVSLVLLLGGFWAIAKAVTAFTIAHSITLIGTTLGFLGLPQRPVESVIALSILFLAVEIIKKDPAKPRLSERIPWVVAFGFGLLHGFGFAGALNEIGLPENDVPTALITFNLGVEAGQLLIVALTATLLNLLRRYAATFAPIALKASTYAIGTIAAFWFIERTLS